MPKFIQYELWKNCGNNCSFCFLRNQVNPLSIEQSLADIWNVLNTDEPRDYDQIGFIGGELFNRNLNRVKPQFYQCVDRVRALMDEGVCKQFLFSAHLIYSNLNNLFEFLDSFDDHSRLMLCTSYDEIGRFHNQRAKDLWYSNLRLLRTRYPKLKIHVEVIVTQRFIMAMNWDQTFNLDVFKDLGVSVDYLEPNTAFEEREAFVSRVPGFLPNREDFLYWVRLWGIEKRVVDLNTLFDPRLRSDVLYYHLNGKLVRIADRHSGDRYIGFEGLEQLPHFGYRDSDIDMRDDVLMLKELQ